MVIVAATALGGAALAEQTVDSAPIQLAVELSDGSRLIGVPTITSAPIVTTVGKFAVPLEQIATMTFSDDHEGISVALVNGDRLTGVHALSGLRLKGLFGDVTVNPALIRKIVCMGGNAAGNLSANLRKGLLLYYSFDRDDGTRAIDRSGQGNHGSVEGAVWVPCGKVGGAYEFNGRDSYIDAGKSTNLNPREALTLAAWVKPDRRTRSGTGFGSVIIRWDTIGGVNERTYLLDVDQARSVMRARISFDGTEGGVAQSMDSKLTGNETWCHFACVWDGAQMSLFRDGELVDSAPCVGVKVSPSTRTGIGAAIGRSGDPIISHFCGVIDEVMIWNRALSPDEVKRLYDAQK